MFIFIVLFISCYYFFKILKIFSCSGMFRDVPECSGMFGHVPAYSGMFHVPGFIDGQVKPSFMTKGGFPLSRACVKFTFSNKIEAMLEWSWMVARKRKSWTSLDFTYKLNTLYPASILLRRVKISCVHTHVKVARKWKPTLNLSTGKTFSEISLSVDRVKSAKYFAYIHNILLTYMVNRRLVSSV